MEGQGKGGGREGRYYKSGHAPRKKREKRKKTPCKHPSPGVEGEKKKEGRRINHLSIPREWGGKKRKPVIKPSRVWRKGKKRRAKHPHLHLACLRNMKRRGKEKGFFANA